MKSPREQGNLGCSAFILPLTFLTSLQTDDCGTEKGSMSYHMWQRKKGEVLLFRFCPVGAVWNEFDISHWMRESSVPLYQPLEQWPQSIWQHPCILFPDALCLSVSVFFCKCSWHFVYLSFKHDGKIMSKNERKKKTSILHLLNLLQGKQFSTIFKTLRAFQDAQKSPARAGHSQRQGTKRTKWILILHAT